MSAELSSSDKLELRPYKHMNDSLEARPHCPGPPSIMPLRILSLSTRGAKGRCEGSNGDNAYVASHLSSVFFSAPP